MKIFETVSFHITKPCNAKCKFCYATFDDMHIRMIDELDAIIIVEKLAAAGVKKITFAGGEPLLFKKLGTVIEAAKNNGMITGIITNGKLLTEDWLIKTRDVLDWVGVSIDSVNKNTNELIGRGNWGMYEYSKLITQIISNGYKLKINTVVNKYNEKESLQALIDWANPDRWKIFDTLRVEGQNDNHWSEIKSTDFDGFISRHNHRNMVIESNELMTGSYLLIDPQGRFFENSKGYHTYSRKITENTIDECLSDITVNRETFISRGGIYNW